jgi:hypothetical protein
MRADELTDEHIGHRVLGIEAIRGWEKNLELSWIETRDNGTLQLSFRWDQNPVKENSALGEFAIGINVPPECQVLVEENPFPTHAFMQEHPPRRAMRVKLSPFGARPYELKLVRDDGFREKVTMKLSLEEIAALQGLLTRVIEESPDEGEWR